MTEREKQIYKSGRKNPNGYKKTAFIFKIKYNKKTLATVKCPKLCGQYKKAPNGR